ncbi:MAG: type II CRISPR RNA-guided endonuclease Cas9 [Clostridia bacterium]|nr:type II CRISPR RNA-guided endonuclease Cas9 [Clostridia bacterium]
MKNEKKYFLGLDVGTESLGWAVTDERYALLKHKGEPMWGVHLFEEAALNDKRRGFRTARRRLDRRQQRVQLVQEIFAQEIAKKDPNFYRRIAESALWREDAHEAYALFCDADYTDKEYHKQYPTIHHLIAELLENPAPHDVRLVYLACAWLVAHRGHFLRDIDKDNISEVLSIEENYRGLMEYFRDGDKPWDCEAEAFGAILKKPLGIKAKYKALCMQLFGAPKAPKTPFTEDGPYVSVDAILNLLCGKKVRPAELFNNAEYEELDSFSLDKDEEELGPILSALGDDSELIQCLKALFDWAVLSDILSEGQYISKAKVKVYEQHQHDLKLLKRMTRAYAPDKYRELFRMTGKGYSAYQEGKKNKDTQGELCKAVKKVFADVVPTEQDAGDFAEMMEKAENNILCPTQKNSDNRVIPYQVYWLEMRDLLQNAAEYLPFLKEADGDGYVAMDKLLSIFTFRVPYFVGPLNKKSRFAWIERKAEGKIYPWNFKDMVDFEKSEKAFIDRMTNTCSYLPSATVMPKQSLLHQRFQVLNEINTLSVNGERIPVEVKQKIYCDLFKRRKKVTKKAIRDYLLREGIYKAEDLETLSGIDDSVKSSLSSYIAFERLLRSGQLTEEDVEAIIQHRTYTEDKRRFAEWVEKTYPALSEADKRYVSGLKFKDFARLSREFLCEIYGTEASTETGEASSIIERMWQENLNHMEILSDRFTYKQDIAVEVAAYYAESPKTLAERMDEMYLSNGVRRSILRTLDVLADIVKVNDAPPKKIFIEMARGGSPKDKGKRTSSRYQQLKELYAKCSLEDVRELEAQLDAMGEDRDNRLQGEKLFLYFLQLGRSMYSYEPIHIEQLGSKLYDIDHIYPQSKVKDDSILNNKVLVLSTENGLKGNTYPVKADIRHKMQSWWRLLLDNGLITPEKYKRLTRHTPFDENEEWGFINRQLVETRQSTKALATLLQQEYPDVEIVYSKAGMVSEFRQEFDMLKCREVNDLHHAKDAYLNIVVGNVYHERFTRSWYLANREQYNLKVETLFKHPVVLSDGRTVWNGEEDLVRVKHIVQRKNAIHLTRYAFCRKGGFFNQMPKAFPEGTVPRKKGLSVEKYGGHTDSTASFFMLAKYTLGKKTEIMVVPIELFAVKRFLADELYALSYIKEAIEKIIGKEVNAVELPLGMRKIKVNTMLELDGMRMCIAGKAGGGRTLILSMYAPLVLGYEWEKYIKHLSSFVEKKKENPNMVYSEKHDGVTKEQNLALYDALTQKLNTPIYAKRPANPVDTLKEGREQFALADIWEQASCLMQIVAVFGRTSGGCNLEIAGGSKHAATTNSFSTFAKNWKKYYNSVHIIDQSASGLYETRSVNLLDLL